MSLHSTYRLRSTECNGIGLGYMYVTCSYNFLKFVKIGSQTMDYFISFHFHFINILQCTQCIKIVVNVCHEEDDVVIMTDGRKLIHVSDDGCGLMA